MDNMKRKISKFKEDGLILWMHYSFLLLFVCITSYSMFDKMTAWWIKLLLVGSVLALALIRHISPKVKSNKIWMSISPYVEALIILPTSLLTASGLTLWFILIIVIDVILDYDFKYSILFSVIGYLLYILFLIIKVVQVEPIPFVDMLVLFIVGAIQYSIIIGASFFAKRYYMQNIQNKELMAKLKVQMLELEEMAILKERNRIAGEIHDTVGHQLTTALVQMEAISVVIDKDLDQAKRRLDIVRDQVKMGLNELRSSVRHLKNERFEDYQEVLLGMVDRVKSTTGVEMDTHFTQIDIIPMSVRKTIYYMSMEAITNAIRHGRCTKIWWRIYLEDENIVVSIENDGVIPNKINAGFGLNRMKDQIEEIDGILSNDVGEHGFIIKAIINTNHGEMLTNE